MAGTMFDRIGGEPTIRLVVEEFYGRMTADPLFAGYFRTVDLAGLRGHQAMLLTLLTGGTTEGPWPSEPAIRALLRRAHGPLRLGDDEFDRMATHLVTVLRQLAVAERDIVDLATSLEDFRDDVVTVCPE
jgi:hemoglobin